MKNKREPRKRRKPTEVLTLVKAHAPQFSPSRVDPILTPHEEHLIKDGEVLQDILRATSKFYPQFFAQEKNLTTLTLKKSSETFKPGMHIAISTETNIAKKTQSAVLGSQGVVIKCIAAVFFRIRASIIRL